jgi:hypothetical protein
MIGTNYTNKLPTPIKDAMKQLTNDDCYLIKRRVKGVTGSGAVLNCHQNVQDLVDRIGGERISGWLLMRKNELYRNGMYIWMFHSIWKTPENEYVDVTQSDVYGNDKVATFWHDSVRRADLDEGTAYNSVITLENDKAVQMIARGTNTQLSIGTPYWTENSVRFFSGLDEHSGMYRMLHSDYPQNTKMLEEQYNCRSEGNRLVPNNKDDKVSTQIFFDFSVS